MDSNDLSVIIPCYGHIPELDHCLRALEAMRSRSDFEIVVVDSSLDARIEALKGLYRHVRVIASERRLSPGAARNLGARNAAGAYLAFLDADCIPGDGWVDEAIACLRSGFRFVGGPVLDANPASWIAWVDNHLQFSDFQRGRPEGPGDHFPSCNLVMTRDLFTAMNGFREDMFSGEDAIFSERLRGTFSSGMHFSPRLVVRHHGRSTLPALWRHQRLLGYYRGRYRLAMTPAWERMARTPRFGGLAVLRRLAYVSLRTWQYDGKELFRLVLSLPLVLYGLTAWTAGFYQGVRGITLMENAK